MHNLVYLIGRLTADPEIKTLRKVTDSNSLYQLTQLFAEREMAGNA